MADEVESSPASPSQDETPGARLRAAREAKLAGLGSINLVDLAAGSPAE